MIYRNSATPLHAARAVVASLYCISLASLAMCLDNPVLLGVLLLVVILVATAAGVRGTVLRVVLWSVPFSATIVVVNALLSNEGLTIVWRFGSVPLFGAIDVTLESLVYGAVLALRAAVIMACFSLHSTAVNPDDLTRLFRRLSRNSALTATLATRLVFTLGRDARRFSEARQSVPGNSHNRMAIARSVIAGALDRAVDTAATLEVRGYGLAREIPKSSRPWSRHDVAFSLATAALAAVSILALVGIGDHFRFFPELQFRFAIPDVVLISTLIVAATVPFLQRYGVKGATS